eukprot:11226927-Lingulodinium_polyedra.AAC.1
MSLTRKRTNPSQALTEALRAQLSWAGKVKEANVRARTPGRAKGTEVDRDTRTARLACERAALRKEPQQAVVW